MGNSELKAALMSGRPVESNGITYKHVSAIILRLDKKGKLFTQVELMDKTECSVSICEPKRIHYKEN